MRSRLQAVGEEDAVAEEVVAPPRFVVEPPPRAESALTGLLTLTLRTLAQRTVVALAALVDCAMVASAFVLWLQVMSGPSVLQLIGLGGYALFILAALWARHRRA